MLPLTLSMAIGAVPLLWSTRATRHLLPALPRTAPNRILAIAVVAVVWLTTSSVVLSVGLPVAVFLAPSVQRAVIDRRDRTAVAAAWPEALETLAMGIGVGMPLEQTIGFVVRCGPPPLIPVFGAVADLLAAGSSRREALVQLARLGGQPVAAPVDVLIAAERNGASVALVLDRLAAEANRAHRLRAEERARRAPVLMLAPLTLCSLPAVMIGTIAPFVLLTFGQTSL